MLCLYALSHATSAIMLAPAVISDLQAAAASASAPMAATLPSQQQSISRSCMTAVLSEDGHLACAKVHNTEFVVFAVPPIFRVEGTHHRQWLHQV